MLLLLVHLIILQEADRILRGDLKRLVGKKQKREFRVNVTDNDKRFHSSITRSSGRRVDRLSLHSFSSLRSSRCRALALRFIAIAFFFFPTRSL